MRFTAVDVETANSDMASICQIGVARFVDGRVVDEWSTLIDPEDTFSSRNVRVHGIREKDVRGRPRFPEILSHLDGFMRNEVCVCHTHFDRVAMGKVFEKYRLEPIEMVWLDSAKVTRRTWADCSRRGYGLADVTRKIGYEFEHHDALEDAKACGFVLIAAAEASGVNVDGWVRRLGQQNVVSRERVSQTSAHKRIVRQRIDQGTARSMGKIEQRETSYLEEILRRLTKK